MSCSDKEASCAKCAYAYWDRTYHGVDIDCKYPLFGDLGKYQDRDEIIDYWHDGTIEYAGECGSFLSAADVKNDVMIAADNTRNVAEPYYNL